MPKSNFETPLSMEEKISGRYNHGDLFCVRDVALFLGVDDTTVRRWILRGQLRSVVLPHPGLRRSYLVCKVDVYNALGYTTIEEK